MPLWLPAAIAAGASLFGASKQNRDSRAEAQRNRDFQERMSSTSWQRGVEDMRAAGLNPALAYSQGGASSPGGSMATQTDVVSPASSSAQGAIRMRKEVRLLDAQLEKVRAEAEGARALSLREEARNAAYGIGKTPSGSLSIDLSMPGLARQVQSEVEFARLQNELLTLQLPWAAAQAGAATKLGRFAAPLSLFQRSGAGPLIGAFSGRR